MRQPQQIKFPFFIGIAKKNSRNGSSNGHVHGMGFLAPEPYQSKTRALFQRHKPKLQITQLKREARACSSASLNTPAASGLSVLSGLNR